MTFGTLRQAQQLLAKLGLTADDMLSAMEWMDLREFDPRLVLQRTR